MGPESVRGIGGVEVPCPMRMEPEGKGASTFEEMELGRTMTEEIELG